MLAHTDLVGDGHTNGLSFTDALFSAVFVYLLKNKGDAVPATERFLADTAPYGGVKCFRSDETGRDSQDLLLKHGIRHEPLHRSAPYQNGWHTLFDMARSTS